MFNKYVKSLKQKTLIICGDLNVARNEQYLARP